MSRPYILALDQGTTSSRAIVFDHNGQSVGHGQHEFAQHYPQPGWVEHDATEIWNTQRAVLQQALTAAGISGDQVAAVGITNQRETSLVWDRHTGEPVHRAIVWQDRRTADRCGKLKAAGHEAIFRERTGLFLDPYFSGTKLQWLLENLDGVRQRAEQGELLFGTIDSWLIWNLTGGQTHVTDVTNSARTLLFNIHTLDWDDQLLALLNIPRQMLPEVKTCSEVYGHVDERILPAGVPVAGIAGDQQAALFGQACFEQGMAKNTYGTGCFLLMNTGTDPVVSQHNLLTTIAWKIGDRTEYALEGSVFIGGAVIQWLRDELQLITSAQECDELAASVPDSHGCYLVPAFTGLGAPHWDPYARGAIFGLTRGTNRAHLCRAALESIALQTSDLLSAMQSDAGVALQELRVDGGAARSDLLLQLQADLEQTCVVRPQCIETTAMGAAYLAGLAVGFWNSLDDITANWNAAKRYSPNHTSQEMETLRSGWQQAIERCQGWAAED